MKFQFLIVENISTFKRRKRNDIIIINLIFAIIKTINAIIRYDISRKLNFDFDYEAIITK